MRPIDKLHLEFQEHIQENIKSNNDLREQLIQMNETLGRVEKDFSTFLNTEINGYPGGITGALQGISKNVESINDRRVFFLSLKKLQKSNPLIYKSIVWTQRLALTLFLLLLLNALLHPLGWEVNFKESFKEHSVKVQTADSTTKAQGINPTIEKTQ